MHAFLQDYLERLTDLHQGIIDNIDDLPSAALDWTPLQEINHDMNSINVLVTHLCGAERYWIGDVALGDPSERVRAAEFEVRGMNAEVLAEKVFAATAYARSALEKLDIEDLAIEKTRLRDERPVTAGWALLHALEHTAIHLGHIQITRQLWDEQQ
jgi:uncharacterized damage-inducible protein DinB